jgi:hypothetical protein
MEVENADQIRVDCLSPGPGPFGLRQGGARHPAVFGAGKRHGVRGGDGTRYRRQEHRLLHSRRGAVPGHGIVEGEAAKLLELENLDSLGALGLDPAGSIVFWMESMMPSPW